MTPPADDTLDALRDLTHQLLSSIDGCRARTDDPGHFRYRLMRAHALAVLDELEQLAPRAPRAAAGEARP